MVSLDALESVGLLSVWMLEPQLPGLLAELKGKGYLTAKVRAKSTGGYSLTFIEPGVVAVKGSTYVLYNPERRSLTVEGSNVDETLLVFNEVEESLRRVGSGPEGRVLFYELQVKARAVGERLVGGVVNASDVLGFNLLAIPMSFVMEDGDPNTSRWFHLDVRPIWTTWAGAGRVLYEVVVIYRDEKRVLLDTLSRLRDVLSGVLEAVAQYAKRGV